LYAAELGLRDFDGRQVESVDVELERIVDGFDLFGQLLAQGGYARTDASAPWLDRYPMTRSGRSTRRVRYLALP